VRKLLIAIWLTAGSAAAANFKLYLNDGTYQLVKEYKVEGDRLRYYSVERSDWEEMPVALVDLKRTEAESKAHQATIERQAKEISDEEAAAAELRKEILKIPQDPGVYRLLDGDQLQILKMADGTLHSSKGRTVLKVLTPVPLVAGKGTLEIPGEHSLLTIKEPRPEFYIQLSAPIDSMAVVKLTPRGGVRIVERITVEPVVNIPTEERDPVEIFTKQLTDSGLYKIWPQSDLPKGEYAVIDYTEGKIDARIFDFRIE
jgi:hypothetical protein